MAIALNMRKHLGANYEFFAAFGGRIKMYGNRIRDVLWFYIQPKNT
jgi:hypothetical protein